MNQRLCFTAWKAAPGLEVVRFPEIGRRYAVEELDNGVFTARVDGAQGLMMEAGSRKTCMRAIFEDAALRA